MQIFGCFRFGEKYMDLALVDDTDETALSMQMFVL